MVRSMTLFLTPLVSARFQRANSLTNDGTYLTTVPTPFIMLHALWHAMGSRKKVKFVAAGLRPAHEKIKDLQGSSQR